MEPQRPQQGHGPAAPPLQDFPPLGASSPPSQGMFRGSGRPHQGSLSGGRGPHRMSAEYRPGPPPMGKTIPTGPHAGASNMGARPFGGGGGFDGPRSPPNAKNTSHVPCKFFKVGQCQAGKACPFSHSTDASKFEMPCKYFSKGNCKFGQKCALVHILPNGRIVNKPAGLGNGNLNIGGRVDPQCFPNQESVIGSSLIAQQVGGVPHAFSHQLPQISPELDPSFPIPPRSQPYDIPQTITTLGTPREEPQQAMSPIPHLSTLDAPLPASFDSNGISYMARHGPVAASMPSGMGLESPPSSLPKKSGLQREAIRNVQEPLYVNQNKQGFNLGSSPLGPPGDVVGQRIMHSQRLSRPNVMSNSMPRGLGQDWGNPNDDPLFGGEEEWIPAGLAHLMTPEERNRRSSGKVENPNVIRDDLAGRSTPADITAKIGSPGHTSSPRFSPWNKPKPDEEQGGFPSPSFGPIGSPLRNTSLHPAVSPSLRAVRGTADLAFKVSSPPRQSSTSILSQQLQRTRLSSRASESNENTTSALHPMRHASNPRSTYDRAVSSTSVSNERIDEEQPEMVFSLDEDHGGAGYNKSTGIWGTAGLNRRPSSRKQTSQGSYKVNGTGNSNTGK